MTSEGGGLPSLPRHVAIIMDGNGRWANLRGLPRVEGHRMGVRAVRAVVECARELRIPCLTLYAFSLENWGRPEPEVLALMTLLKEFLVSELSLLLRHRIRLRVIGETSSLPFAVRQVLERTVSATAENTEMTLTLGLSYTGRNEIVRAARRLAAEAAEG
jgi:undecaprenyl diphosphate synthase